MKKILDRRGKHILFLICWFAYFCSYLGRMNYSSVMSVLIGNQLTKMQAGWVNTAFFISYATGQLVNGIIAERFSPKIMVFIGLITGATSNVVFGFTDSFWQMVCLRLITGYSMSMLWPSMVCAMSRSLRKNDMQSISVDLCTSMAAGSLVSYALNAYILRALDWRYTFYIPALLLFTAAVVWIAAFPGEKRINVIDETEEDVNSNKKETLSLARLITIPALQVALIPVILHGAIKDGVTSWVPTYVREVFNTSASFSVLVTILLPIVSLLGAYIGKYAYRKAKGNAFTSSAVLFLFALAGFAVMLTIGKGSVALTLAMLAVITGAMMGTNIVFINFLAFEFEVYGRSATVSGGLNAIAYGGSAIASGFIGVLSESYGWYATVISWSVMMLIGLVICAVFRNASTALKGGAR